MWTPKEVVRLFLTASCGAPESCGAPDHGAAKLIEELEKNGYVIVPKEPTEKMASDFAGPLDTAEHWWLDAWIERHFAEGYRAMINAAPAE